MVLRGGRQRLQAPDAEDVTVAELAREVRKVGDRERVAAAAGGAPARRRRSFAADLRLVDSKKLLEFAKILRKFSEAC